MTREEIHPRPIATLLVKGPGIYLSRFFADGSRVDLFPRIFGYRLGYTATGDWTTYDQVY